MKQWRLLVKGTNTICMKEFNLRIIFHKRNTVFKSVIMWKWQNLQENPQQNKWKRWQFHNIYFTTAKNLVNQILPKTSHRKLFVRSYKWNLKIGDPSQNKGENVKFRCEILYQMQFLPSVSSFWREAGVICMTSQ